ncbi:MAG: 50S ribosomal protein L10 [Lentisphaerae bacterium]|nr:50S ribosomal protein L10 [Lentisphaerota bacterium]
METAVEGWLDTEYTLLVDYRGMSVKAMSDLRTQLRASGASCRVVKNRVVGRVGTARGWSESDGLFFGPTAIITGGDIVAASRTLKTFAKPGGLPAAKGGIMGDRMLSGSDVVALAEIPSREVLYGMVVGTLAAPMRNLVGVMQQKLSSLLYVLRAVEEKKKSEE